MLLVATDPAFLEHDPGRGHPERPARLGAVLAGIDASGLGAAIVPVAPRAATRRELERIHDPAYLDRLERMASAGGGRLDPDTAMSASSWVAATRAVGAALAAADELRAGRGAAAFVAARPPGHHALPARAMGFCLVNTVAVLAADLAARGERVAILDYDAHHGNGTEAAFADRGDVLYVSWHEWPLYPGTGALRDVGSGAGLGCTCNVPLPAGATGDAYLRSWDEVVGPLVETFDPGWVLVSAGFDAHRADPLTGIGLSAGDFADLTARIAALAPPGRLVGVLEGGYDLEALRDSVAASLPRLLGETAGPRPEPATSGGPGLEVVRAVARARESLTA